MQPRKNLLIVGTHFWFFLMLLLAVMGGITWWLQRNSIAEERISFGEKSLIPRDPSLDKKAVMKAIADRKLSNVKDKFDNWVENNNNDPEALIFFNNANIGDNPSYTIAVSVPISKDNNNINNSLEILRGVQQFLSSGKFKITGASGDIEFCPSGDRKNAKVELVQIVPNTNSSSTTYKFAPVTPYKDKPSSDCPGSPTNNNSSPTPTSSPLPTTTPTLTSTRTPSSSTTSLASDSVCRLQPESPESYKANVVSRQGLNLRAEPRQDSKSLKLLKFNQIIIILKENKDKSWQNVCEEGTNLEGWVKAEYTKKVVE